MSQENVELVNAAFDAYFSRGMSQDCLNWLRRIVVDSRNFPSRLTCAILPWAPRVSAGHGRGGLVGDWDGRGGRFFRDFLGCEGTSVGLVLAFTALP